MAVADANMFPDNIAAIVGNLASPGSSTNNIFEMREAVIRSLAAFGAIKLTRSANQPVTPAKWDFWITPGVLAGSVITSGNLKVWSGAQWLDVTPALFAAAVVGKHFPADAAGVLANDGSGTLSWLSTNLSVNTVANASGNITLDGNYDVSDLTLTGNVTLNAMSNFTANRPHFVRLRQDGVGGRTISLNVAVFKAGAITLSPSSSAGAIDIMGLMARTTALAELTMWNRGV